MWSVYEMILKPEIEPLNPTPSVFFLTTGHRYMLHELPVVVIHRYLNKQALIISVLIGTRFKSLRFKQYAMMKTWAVASTDVYR